MNDSTWVWASQLASGTVLWNEYTQASRVVQDFHIVLPLSVAMRTDVTPWLDWLTTHEDIVPSMESQFYKPLPELMAAGMVSWMNGIRGSNTEKNSLQCFSRNGSMF